MEVSFFSLIMSIIFFSIGVLIMSFLKKRNNFIISSSISSIMFLAVLSIIRIALNFEFENSIYIESKVIYRSNEIIIPFVKGKGLRRITMKKSTIGTIFIIACCLFLSSCKKKAERIELPLTGEVESVEVALGSEDITHTDKEWIDSFMQKVRDGRPTSKESVQDVPNVSQYTKADVFYSDKLSTVFIYKEDSKWYVEHPYQGIYEVDETISSLLEVKD